MNMPLMADNLAARKGSVLVVDDEPRAVEAMERVLKFQFQVYTATSAREAEEILRYEFIQVVVCDHRMPDELGVDFLKRVRAQWPDVIRILISAYSDFQDTVRGINEAGIYQYVSKPWEPEQLLLTVKNAVDLFNLNRQNRLMAVELKLTPQAVEESVRKKARVLKQKYDFDEIIRTPGGVLDKVLNRVRQIAPFDISVLIHGPSGSGKELVARAIHYASDRADKPFVAQNCAALPDDLLESELFGYKKGAFTGAYQDHEGLFEQADGGTLFLDEVGDLSPAFQVKLLRVLQEGEVRPLGHSRAIPVDVRVIAATHHDLEELVKTDRFREDLYYRLAGFVLQLPPLKARKADIPLLVKHMLNQLCRQYGRENCGITEEAMDALMNYHWPGNIRELQNEIGRLFVMTPEGEPLRAEYLSPRVLRGLPEENEAELNWIDGLGGSLKERVEAYEKRVIKEALIRHHWNKTRVAEELGLSRVGLHKKIQRYGLESKPGEAASVTEASKAGTASQ
jgi:two-component system response regulator HupR/HoxA